MLARTSRTALASPLVGTVAVVSAGALWAIAATVARDLFEDGVPPLELAAARAVIAALALSLIRPAWARAKEPKPLLVVSLGLAIALVNAAYYVAIDHLAVAVAIVLQYTGPAMLVGWIALRSKTTPSPEIVVALAAALAGVVLVSELPGGDLQDLDGVGIAAGLASAVLFAGYTLLSERAGKIYGPLGALRRAFTAASCFWIATQLLRGRPDELFAAANVPGVLFVGLMGTLAPFSLYLWGVGRIRAERASIVATSEPVLAALFAWMLLGQTLSPMQIVGGLSVIAAIVTLEIRAQARTLTPEP
jgi:drug/metabolite transporter (DMT)-like permease